MTGEAAILAGALLLTGHAPAQDRAAAESAAFIDHWCIDCHEGAKPKGGLSLEALQRALAADAPALTPEQHSLLRLARRRVAENRMPPRDRTERPDANERAQATRDFDGVLRPRDPALPPPGGAPRRLNRTEYANTVRDLLGIDATRLGSLAPDDVGGGFDNVAAVLSLAPSGFERAVELAEAIAAEACPPADAAGESTGAASGAPRGPATRRLGPEQLTISKDAGQRTRDGALLWSNGEARGRVELPREGTYALVARVYGMQAGRDPVKVALLADKRTLGEFPVRETAEAPGVRRVETTLRGGVHTVAVAFLNDFYEKNGPGGKPADRNAMVLELTVEGPLDVRPTPAWRTAMAQATSSAAPAQRERAEFAWLVERFLRRPVRDADLAMCAQVADASATAAPDADPDARERRLRAVLTALLVHPEFLFRVESEVPAGAPARDLAPHELAARLSYFLWASCPDEALRTAAARGELATPQGRAAQVRRMLDDPRATSLAERFATQWLGIDGVEQRAPDPTQFPGMDAALLASMRTESVLFFDSVLREGRPVWTLLDADYTFVDERLARHYGMPAPGGAGMRRVPVDPARGGGVLAQASVLLCTSNPTRTSPVKRGKWVLEALLDDAPPPPPPGTPQLPERVPGAAPKPMREMLAAHRADPACAACHRRMDALGFAFEAYDPVGRRRDRADGVPVDPRGDLPDGSAVVDIAGVRQTLRGDRAFLRSLVKHLLVYATGRELEAQDDAALEELLGKLGNAPTLADAVTAIVESPTFRMRGAS